MDNMKILEQYANEFMEVITAYNSKLPELKIKEQDNLERILLIASKNGIPVFSLKIENNSVRINNLFTQDTFYDSAPFLPKLMESSHGN
jgi:hypothetical protein